MSPDLTPGHRLQPGGPATVEQIQQGPRSLRGQRASRRRALSAQIGERLARNHPGSTDMATSKRARTKHLADPRPIDFEHTRCFRYRLVIHTAYFTEIIPIKG
jgi:hypothetical protein